MSTTYKDIMGKLAKKQYAPIYLLHGEEPFYIDQIADKIENESLDEMEKSFNLIILYGKDSDARTVTDACRRYPVMAQRQVVIVREAQSLKDIENLDAYATKPVESTILVLCHKHKKFDGRKKLAGLVAKSGVVFEAAKLYDNQVSGWINEYLSGHNIQIRPEAAQMMADYLGTDLSKISNELDKLLISLPQGKEITTDIITENIGISKDFNVFELQTAIAKRDNHKIGMIVNHFAANPKDNPLIMINATLYSFFSSLYLCQFHRNASDKDLVGVLFMRDAKPDEINNGWRRLEWKLRDFKAAMGQFNRQQTETAISLLREFDLKAKGVGADNTDDGELVREMVWRIMAGA